jgi:hypothetical protein
MRQPAIFAITVGRGVPQSNFSRRKTTPRYAAEKKADISCLSRFSREPVGGSPEVLPEKNCFAMLRPGETGLQWCPFRGQEGVSGLKAKGYPP